VIDEVFRSTPTLTALSHNSRDFELIEMSSDGNHKILAPDAYPLQSMLFWQPQRVLTAYGDQPNREHPPTDCLFLKSVRHSQSELAPTAAEPKKKKSMFGFKRKSKAK
jgi:hypothetical protein